MIQTIPGSAVFETSQGSAAARTKGPEQVAQIQAVAPADRHSGAHDAHTLAPRSQPASPAAGAERDSDDRIRGGRVDMRV